LRRKYSGGFGFFCRYGPCGRNNNVNKLSAAGRTATKPGAAAHNTAQTKIDKYSKLASTHIFYPFAIETAGTWHEMAIDLTQEIGRRITTIAEYTRETTFLFQRFSMALQRGNVVYFHDTMVTE